MGFEAAWAPGPGPRAPGLGPLHDNPKGLFIEESAIIQRYGRAHNLVWDSHIKKCLQVLKAASESSGKRVKMQGCSSFRRKSFI